MDDRLNSLLLIWQDEQARGREVSAAELCGDCPELAVALQEQIRLLRQMNALMKPGCKVAISQEKPVAAELANTPSGFQTQDEGTQIQTDAPEAHRLATLPSPPGYEVQSELGRGGMGVVYKARQVQLKRTVALKMILAGDHAGAAALARFLHEAEIVAQLKHPNIVQIYECGSHEGKPFIALEFIEGGALAEHLKGEPQPPRKAAQLVETLARAMHVAHEQGIVHRDLKPANVLLDKAGVPKISDFGLAKRADSGMTATGAVMGTPSYMAPEQAEGKTKELGPAADIYALGAILYELLTGRPPFKGESAWDTVQMVISIEPVAPSQLQPKVPRDLETICLKCLQKAPARRYATAIDLAEDLGRFLAGEPIRARRVGWLERTAKWVRKRPAAAAAIGLTVVLVAAFIAGAFWYLKQENRRALNQIQQAQARAMAEEGIRSALDEADRTRRDLQRTLGRSGGVFELLNRPESWEAKIRLASAALERAEALLKNHNAVNPELAEKAHELTAELRQDDADRRLAVRLDEIRHDNEGDDGNVDNARLVQSYEQAFADSGLRLFEDTPAALASQIACSLIKEQFVATLDSWAQSALYLRRLEVTNRLLEVARLAAPDPNFGDRLRQPAMLRDRKAVAELVKDARTAGLSPNLLHMVGRLLDGNLPREAWLRQAQDQYPADYWLNLELGHALIYGKSVESAGFYRVAITIRPGSAWAYCSLGVALRNQKRLSEAIAAYQTSISLNPKFAYAHSNLGLALFDQKRLPEAITVYRKAIDLNPNYPEAYRGLGVALFAQNKLPEAIAAYRKAIDLDPKFAETYSNLGVALFAQNKLPEAIAAYQKAIELDPNNASTRYNLGRAYAGQKKLPEAIVAFQKAIDLDPSHAPAHRNLGAALLDQKKLPEAIAALQKAIGVDPNHAAAHYNLGLALFAQNKLPEAIAAYQKAIDLDPKFAVAYLNLGGALHNQKKLPEAIAAYQKAIELDPNNATTRHNLGRAYAGQKKLPEAIVAFQKAIDLDPSHTPAHRDLGIALIEQKKLPEAIVAFQKAIDLDPSHAPTHKDLGIALFEQKKLPEAIAAHQKAIDLDPTFAVAHCNLGLMLRNQARFAEACASLRLGHSLGSKDPAWPYPSARELKECEQLLLLDGKLEAVMAGMEKLASADEHLQMANLCGRYKKYYAAAARFYDEAFAKAPALAEDLAKDLRFTAACAAALAAAGEGKDAGNLESGEKSKFRQNSLKWLQADLASFRKQLLDGQARESALIVEKLRQWKTDPDLARVRDTKELDLLPTAEREVWRTLWAEIDSMLIDARGRSSKTENEPGRQKEEE